MAMDQQMGFIRANRVVRQKAPKAEDFLNVVAPRKLIVNVWPAFGGLTKFKI